MNSKRSQAVLSLAIILVMIIIVALWVTSCESGECAKDTDCPEQYYCAADRNCHLIPVIEKTVINYDLRVPALIIGGAIVLAALIIRRKKKPIRPKPHNDLIPAKAHQSKWTRPYKPS